MFLSTNIKTKRLLWEEQHTTLRPVNANIIHTHLNLQRDRSYNPPSVLTSKEQGSLSSVIIKSMSHYLRSFNSQCQWQSCSKMSFRAALWALLSASFSSLVHAACCAPAFPVSLSSGTDAWHGPHRYMCQRTSWHCALRGTASGGLSVHYTHLCAGEVTGRGACWVKGLLNHCGNTVERLCHLRSFPANLGVMSR